MVTTGLLAAATWAGRHATSQAVRRWRPGAGRSRTTGQLRVRTFGAGDPVVVLLHGMIAGGNFFGADFDRLAAEGTVVVPDLLGFGDSDRGPVPLTAADHLAALDDMLHALALGGRRLVVVGHSMGGVVALRWAAEHIGRVAAVVTFCAPLYRSRAEADAGMRRMGLFEALLTGDGPMPRTMCAWMCRFRTTASWLAVAIRPDLPVEVARSAVEHTWSSYSGSLNSFIHNEEWEPALHRLAATGVPVVLAEAAHDPVPVPGRAADLTAERPGRTYALHPTADHGLPLVDGPWCAELVADVCRAGTAR